MILDALFVNGQFRTLDPHRPTASAIGVISGRIVAFDDEARGLRSREVVDLENAHVVPGFNDAHHHVSQQGERLRMVNLSADLHPSVEAALDALRTASTAFPEGSWVLATSYDQHRLGRYPSIEELDRATDGRPLWMLQVSGHMGVANSAALAAAGISLDNPPTGIVDGGYVETDERGRATGLLTEGAMSYVTRLLKPTSFDEWVECIRLGNLSALADGITSVTETGVVGPGLSGNGPADIGAFQAARAAGYLDVRMTLMPEAATLRGHDGSWGYGGIRTGFGDDRIKLGATKFFVDGSLLGQTAAVSEPFLTNGSLGEFQDDPELLRERIIEAHTAGWQVACHAIGDRAVRLVLDAYERALAVAPRDDTRHRIEHAAITTADDIARMKAIGAVPVPQAHFIGAFGDGMRAALGDERVTQCYRQASFLRAGLVVPGSSDCPVTDGSPLRGIHDLVNRETIEGAVFGPDERLTAAEALDCYTRGSAYASHDENDRGALAAGMLADFAVLDHDLLEMDPAGIKEVSVLRTVIGGETVYTR